MAYPSTITTFTNPTSSVYLSAPSHSAIETAQNTDLTAVETFLGVDGASSTVGTLIYDIRSPGSNGGGHIQTANKGGTGQTTFNKGDMLVAQSSSVLTKLGVGTDGQALLADSTQATGIKWGLNGGISAASVATVIPYPDFVSTATNQDQIALNTNMHLGRVVLPAQIYLKNVSFNVTSVNSAGPINIGLYSEGGQNQVFSVQTTSIFSNGIATTTLVSSVLVLPGTYYLGMSPRGSSNYILSANRVDDLSSTLSAPTGKAVVAGKYSIVANTLPTSILTSSINPDQTSGIMVRFDN